MFEMYSSGQIPSIGPGLVPTSRISESPKLGGSMWPVVNSLTNLGLSYFGKRSSSVIRSRFRLTSDRWRVATVHDHATECYLTLVRGDLYIVWSDPCIKQKPPQWRLQSFSGVSLFKKLIGKSRCPQNKHLYEEQIRTYRISCEIKMYYRQAKMEYCYSGTGILWHENWIRHVCHKWKYEVDIAFLIDKS